MYLRFVSAERHPFADAELGIYAAQQCIDWQHHPAWLQEMFQEGFAVFRRLRVPPDFKRRRLRRQARQALSWLKADGADWILDDIRLMAWAMGEAGIEIRSLRTRDPGMVLWEDAEQVLALPNGRVPRAF